MLSKSLFPSLPDSFLPGQYKKEEPIFHNETSTVQWLGRGVSTAEGTSPVGEIRSHKPTGREGNDNPLQYSCLENSRDRGAWWAAIYGVTQSWTRLK